MRIKKKIVYTAAAIIILIACIGVFWPRERYVRGDSFSYINRPSPGYAASLLEENDSLSISKISFESRPLLDHKTTVYGLLLMPKKEHVPGVVLLPGGGVKKEDEMKLATTIARQDIAVLVIDQRGIGETAGYALAIEQDAQLYEQGKEPYQHLSVYDALRSFDVMGEIENVDKRNIAIVGASMGGRYGIIATAIEPKVKGFIGISTSGFHIPDTEMQYADFLRSIDPDRYVKRISPRKLFMLHGTDDTTIPIESAKNTYGEASEPKQFFYAEGCRHGYCDAMEGNLSVALEEMFS